MGFFDLFGKKEEGADNAVLRDKVYISAQGKMNACLELAKEQPEMVFIAWFSETAKRFKTFFSENGIDADRIQLACTFHPASHPLAPIIFLEHYPLAAKELECAENWKLPSSLVFSSMDEPLFLFFGSEKMIPLVKLLGIKENEPIEHSYVSQSIHKGQHKIADKVTSEHLADSQDEWMRKNMVEE